MTYGIEMYLETHNWGKTVKFWQQLGCEIDLDLGTSGRLVHKEGGYSLFIQEIAEDREPGSQIYLRVRDEGFRPEPPAEITADWHDSHWGTRLLTLRDPDGRAMVLQHGSASQ